MAVKLNEPGRLSPPIWPCTTRGFPCLACCQLELRVCKYKPWNPASGGLLPHRFTLACGTSLSKTSHRFPCSMPPCFAPPAVYSLWHFPWVAAQTGIRAAAPLALPGALPI